MTDDLKVLQILLKCLSVPLPPEKMNMTAFAFLSCCSSGRLLRFHGPYLDEHTTQNVFSAMQYYTHRQLQVCECVYMYVRGGGGGGIPYRLWQNYATKYLYRV